MSQTPEAPALLSDARVAEIAEWLKLPMLAIENNPGYAKFALDDLLADRADFRQQVATELRGLRALAVELCVHGGHLQPEEIDDVATRLGINLTPTPDPSAT